jgi:Ca-activated chloride channel family protein
MSPPLPALHHSGEVPKLRSASSHFGVAILAALFLVITCAAVPQTRQRTKLPRPRKLDQAIDWQRDPATGELRPIPAGRQPSGNEPSGQSEPHNIQVVAKMVAVTCGVSTSDGTAVPGLTRSDFRIFDNGVQQTISYFDASAEPASVALVIDASPSVLPQSGEMKRAADALVQVLAPLDEAAVVDFSAHTYLQLPFSDVRELIRRAVDRVDVRQLLDDSGGSNIYQAVYLTARDLFPGRKGRKSIVLLTDGQDSGLGLTLDPATQSPLPGIAGNRLTFDDVAQLLATNDIQVFAVSTENRPKGMTPAWLAAHANTTLVTAPARGLAIPAYTLYLAELVRRSGGQLYFLREKPTMADTFREIARKIRAEYTLGYYPTDAMESSAASSPAVSGSVPSGQAGWHQLRVELPNQTNPIISHRAAYYAPQTR